MSKSIEQLQREHYEREERDDREERSRQAAIERENRASDRAYEARVRDAEQSGYPTSGAWNETIG